MNKTCYRVIDEREKGLHIKIYHPHYRSLINTTGNYEDLDRFKTPKQIVKLLFSEIQNKKNENLEGFHAV